MQLTLSGHSSARGEEKLNNNENKPAEEEVRDDLPGVNDAPLLKTILGIRSEHPGHPTERSATLAGMDATAEPNAQKFQYVAMKYRSDKMQSVMDGFNALGARGWEMVTIVPGIGEGTAMFKRPLKRGKIRL
jgi:hypothetical protein